MSDSRFQVDHVRLATDKPFEEVAQAFERQLGRFDPDVYKSLAASGDAEAVRAKIEALVGPSGFMLFVTHNHGALLRLAGQKRKAIQYVVGNPLFALPDDAARHPGEPLRPAACADLRERRGEDLRGVRQAIFPLWPIRRRPQSAPPLPCSTGSWRRWWQRGGRGRVTIWRPTSCNRQRWSLTPKGTTTHSPSPT